MMLLPTTATTPFSLPSTTATASSTATIATLPALTTPWELPPQCSVETISIKGGQCYHDDLGPYCMPYLVLDVDLHAWAKWPYQPYAGAWTSTECFPPGFSHFEHSSDNLDFFYTPATACPSAWTSVSKISAGRYDQSVTLCCPSAHPTLVSDDDAAYWYCMEHTTLSAGGIVAVEAQGIVTGPVTITTMTDGAATTASTTFEHRSLMYTSTLAFSYSVTVEYPVVLVAAVNENDSGDHIFSMLNLNQNNSIGVCTIFVFLGIVAVLAVAAAIQRACREKVEPCRHMADIPCGRLCWPTWRKRCCYCRDARDATLKLSFEAWRRQYCFACRAYWARHFRSISQENIRVASCGSMPVFEPVPNKAPSQTPHRSPSPDPGLLDEDEILQTGVPTDPPLSESDPDEKSQVTTNNGPGRGKTILIVEPVRRQHATESCQSSEGVVPRKTLAKEQEEEIEERLQHSRARYQGRSRGCRPSESEVDRM